MESIRIPFGIIAIGGSKGEGKTKFCLKLANHLAQKEKVLFISYQNYKEQLTRHLAHIDNGINPGLKIKTNFNYFGLDVFVKLMRLVSKKSYATVFIDNSEFFNSRGYYGDVDEFIEALKLMEDFCRVKIVFTVNIDSHADDYGKKPILRDFNSSSIIKDTCSKILAIYRPYIHGYNEDENGQSLIDRLDIYTLKNEDNDEPELISMNWSDFNSYHFDF